MRVKYLKDSEWTDQVLQDFSEDLRESNKSLHFLSQGEFSTSLKEQITSFFVCPEYISWRSYVRMGRDLQRHRATIAFVIVITPQDFLCQK